MTGPTKSDTAHKSSLKYFFDEFEIVTEPEEQGEAHDKSEKDAMKEYEVGFDRLIDLYTVSQIWFVSVLATPSFQVKCMGFIYLLDAG